MNSDPFHAAWKACAWAKDEIAQVEEGVAQHERERPVEVAHTRNETTGAIIVYPIDIVPHDGIIDQIGRSAYAAVQDLRNALDYACHAASVAAGSYDDRRTNFPVAEDEVDLKRRLENAKGTYRGIPKQLHGALIDLQPFWKFRDGREGNIALRTLCDIANENKHRIPVEIGFRLDLVELVQCNSMTLEINPAARISPADRPEVHARPEAPVHSFACKFDTVARMQNAGAFSEEDAVTALRMMHSAATGAVETLSSASPAR